MLVDTSMNEVFVPRAFIENGQIILNISPDATHSLVLGNDSIQFNARFSGAAMDVSVPVSSVLAIYAKENGQGMVFEEQEGKPPEPPGGQGQGSGSSEPAPPSGPKKPNLKIVK